MSEYSIDQMRSELIANGWKSKTSTIWASPSGKLFLGPAGAFRVMKSEHREPSSTSWGSVIELVNHQAEDEDLWFVARTAPEAYLQQELRRLHALIEHIAGTEQRNPEAQK